jgi:hypothetical protein
MHIRGVVVVVLVLVPVLVVVGSTHTQHSEHTLLNATPFSSTSTAQLS